MMTIYLTLTKNSLKYNDCVNIIKKIKFYVKISNILNLVGMNKKKN